MLVSLSHFVIDHLCCVASMQLSARSVLGQQSMCETARPIYDPTFLFFFFFLTRSNNTTLLYVLEFQKLNPLGFWLDAECIIFVTLLILQKGASAAYWNVTKLSGAPHLCLSACFVSAQYFCLILCLAQKQFPFSVLLSLPLCWSLSLSLLDCSQSKQIV